MFQCEELIRIAPREYFFVPIWPDHVNRIKMFFDIQSEMESKV